MKSDLKHLRIRGYIDDMDIREYTCLDNTSLWNMLYSLHAHERTIAIRSLLVQDQIQHANFVDYLINQLSIERALYTKIEICNALQLGSDEVAEKLIPYLGEIGHNQHVVLGKTSHKKSYPLARDIVARSLCSMKLSTGFLERLCFLQPKQLKEAMDAIGYQLFYHPDLIQPSLLNNILLILTSSNDQVLQWKCLTCLSAFPLCDVEHILMDYASHEDIHLQEEAQRSFKIIKGRGKE